MSTTALKRSYNAAFSCNNDDGDTLMSSPTSSPQFSFSDQSSSQPSSSSNFSFNNNNQSETCRLFEQPIKRRRYALKHGSDEVPYYESNPTALASSCSLQSLLSQHGSLTNSASQRNINRPEYFAAPSQLGKDEAKTFISQYTTEKRRQKQQQSKLKPKKTFSEDEVRMILEVREQQLRDEYDLILQKLLQEQFTQFAKFNQDYISRQFKSSDFSYTS